MFIFPDSNYNRDGDVNRIWPGYPAINQEYKIIVKIVLFA